MLTPGYSLTFDRNVQIKCGPQPSPSFIIKKPSRPSMHVGTSKRKYALFLHKWNVQIRDGVCLRVLRVLRCVARRGEAGRRNRRGRERGQGIGLGEVLLHMVRVGCLCASPRGRAVRHGCGCGVAEARHLIDHLAYLLTVPVRPLAPGGS
jgi:hypothetical protein